MRPFWKKKIEAPSAVETALIGIIETHQAQLYRIAFSYVRSEQDALEVVQEAVYKAIVSQNQIKDISILKTWLIRIVINCAIDMSKKNSKWTALDETALTKQHDEGAASSEEKLDLQEALEKLEEPEKSLIQLRFFEDLPLNEIAVIMQLPLSTVKSQLYRSLKRLKVELEGVDEYE